MVLKQDALNDICELTTKQVQDLYPDLQLMFIPHESGQFHEIIETNEHEVLKHPAGKIAKSILEKNATRELSSFLGMAIDHQVKWLGLSSRENVLGLFNINTSEFTGPKDARRGIYHLAWHAIDLFEIRQKPEYASKFRSGPMIPKRSPLNMARLNLQADIFSAIMSGLMGEEDALDALAHLRAKDSIAPIYTRRAEDYPYVIALETAKYAYNELQALKIPRAKYMHYARQVAIEVSQAFDETNIKQWWGFSEPAQDMAWRNFSPELILGCSIYTSEDTFVRATAHLVSDISDIAPAKGVKLSGTYNPFATQESNQLLHRELVEKAFQEAMARGVAEESGQPLLLAANAQNADLVEGRILGWCANALQAAAKAFEGAVSSGISPAQAAALEFQSTKEDATWDSLKKIGDNVVEQKRKGFAITMNDISDMAASKPEFAFVATSVKATMSDPSYVQQLSLTKELAVKPVGLAAAPVTPAPKAAPTTPHIAIGPAGPSLGGAANPKVIAHQRAMLEKLRAEQDGKKEGQ